MQEACAHAMSVSCGLLVGLFFQDQVIHIVKSILCVYALVIRFH